jgi:hypothetical protein
VPSKTLDIVLWAWGKFFILDRQVVNRKLPNNYEISFPVDRQVDAITMVQTVGLSSVITRSISFLSFMNQNDRANNILSRRRKINGMQLTLAPM